MTKYKGITFEIKTIDKIRFAGNCKADQFVYALDFTVLAEHFVRVCAISEYCLIQSALDLICSFKGKSIGKTTVTAILLKSNFRVC